MASDPRIAQLRAEISQYSSSEIPKRLQKRCCELVGTTATISELARRLGIAPQRIYKWRMGLRRKKPQTDRLQIRWPTLVKPGGRSW